MIERLYYHIGNAGDPYYNLALEQFLMETVPENCCILYLWQNLKTVVIGRNQNPWKECRTTELAKDGGHLARRLSGGGAVYHDGGNLNFTFLVPKRDYDLPRQMQVVLQACRSLGVEAELTGRNDVAVDGRKISGNAYYDSRGKAYHHGTLLIDVNPLDLARYLTPSKAKLAGKGVDSVRSRVMNLKELLPELTVAQMEEKMVEAFTKVYGIAAEKLPEGYIDEAAVEALRARNASWEWNYGRMCETSFRCEEKFSWGSVELKLEVESGTIRDARVHTDAMDWSVAEVLRQCLLDRPFRTDAITDAVEKTALPEEWRQDLCRLIRSQDL